MTTNHYRVRPGERDVLDRIRPDDKGKFAGKDEALETLERGVKRLETRQELLYAQRQYALLVVMQGLDAAGKDSAIKHVLSGVNPAGVDVHSFKEPSHEELDHDFLWRTAKALPSRGRIGIFNRSHYEEVLVVRVHPELLEAEHLPRELRAGSVWKQRFEDINAFEHHLHRNGTIIRKFFLYVSRQEQAKRLLARLSDPGKNWKFSPSDVEERRKWRRYMAAYREALAATSSEHAPWYVIPADHKWFAHVLIAEIIVKTLDDLALAFPKVDPEKRRILRRFKHHLENAL